MKGQSLGDFTACAGCRSANVIWLNTYKRHWQFCRDCGEARSLQKEAYPWRILPIDDFRKPKKLDEGDMYDYFVDDVHINHSIIEGKEFIEQYIRPNGIDLNGKRLIDISGGNGHVANELRKEGADIVLTEINEPALTYAREKLGLTTAKFNFQDDRIETSVDGKFDIICVRAAAMFCRDLEAFVDGLASLASNDAILIFDRCVRPTLGTLVRVQLDEFSYISLRQPETIISICEARGFALKHRHDEIDPAMYIYDHDLLNHWFIAHYWYEIAGARKLRGKREFDIPARDRRRATMIFKYREQEAGGHG